MPTLTADQVIFYHIEGYLSLDQLVSAEEVSKAREIYDALFARKAGRASGDHFDLGGTDLEGDQEKLPQILDVSKHAPELKEFEFYKAAIELSRQLLGDACIIKGEHAINKPGMMNNPTPWHQDEAYWDPSRLYESLSIWIPLQEVTTENGCLQFLPRSHRLGVLDHQSIGGDVRVHGLEVCDAGFDLDRAVACPLPAGGATIHANRMMHYASPNRSSEPRRALIIMAELPSVAHPFHRRFPWNEIKHTAREMRAKEEKTAT